MRGQKTRDVLGVQNNECVSVQFASQERVHGVLGFFFFL